MAERFEIDQTTSIFQGDSEFLERVAAAGTSMTTAKYEMLSETLIDSHTHISSTTVSDLLDENYLNSELGGIFGGDSADIYRQTFYTYKYSAVKLFFRKNWKKFLPEFDAVQIDSQEKSKIFTEAFMREYDRFSLIIDNIYNVVDINKVPVSYLDYLAQLIGYERDDFLLIDDISFRELIKNMIEIYQIKGSNYSFELFFNFLGFDITLNEFWFDKRYGDTNINTNQYTSSTDEESYLFYLTPYKPTKVIPSNMSAEYGVTEDLIKETLDLNMFDKYISWYNNGDARGYSAKQLLGDTDGFTGDTYTYFKSNIIQYTLTTLGTEQESELTEEDQEVINLYVRFLTPIYINARLSLAATPYSDQEPSLFLKDFNRLDPVYVGPKIGNHTWEFRVTAIDVDIGDTFTQRSSITVTDPLSILYNNIKWYDMFYLSGDTYGDTLAGRYPVFGDTRGDSTTGYDVYGGDTIYKSHSGSSTVIYVPYKLASFLGDSNIVDKGNVGHYLRIGGPDTMFHLYEGLYPSRYHWGDTELGDSAIMNWGDTNRTVDVGGHFIGGLHDDTRSVIYDPSNPISAYYKIAAANPTWTEEQVLASIRSKITDRTLFNYVKGSTYRVRNRDVLLPIDSVRNISPGDTLSGDSWVRYFSINEGDSIGDSVYHSQSGFMNPTTNFSYDLGEVGPITFGMNTRLQDNGINRIESTQYVDKTRESYYLFSYSSGDTVMCFQDGEIITGDSSGAKARVLTSNGGDSTFIASRIQGRFFVGEGIIGDSSGDSGILDSYTKYTDDYGSIRNIDVVNGSDKGEVRIYDPGNGDTYRYEFHPLTSDDYITLYGLTNGDTTARTYRVSSTTHDGDTTIVELGDSLPGSDQITSGGYIYNTQIGFIKSIDVVNANDVGQIAVYDLSGRFANLITGDTIRLKDRGDTNEGIYTVGDSILHVRTGVGDTTIAFTTFELGDSLPGADGDSGGVIEIYAAPWTLGTYSYGQHEYLEILKI